VEVDHAVKAIVLGLQRHEFGDGAEIVAEMQIAGGLDAGKDAGFLLCHAGPYGVALTPKQVFRIP
jgi:hypothetical protein